MSSQAPGETIKVLIVDDIPDTRENLRKLLKLEPGMEVVGAAGTGLEAIELAKQTKPDVVLMDINMPDMDGITATKNISTTVRTAAVVIMSVQSEPGYLRQAMLAGARDFLTKPISSEELYTTIRRVYERNAPIREQEKQMTMMPQPMVQAAVKAQAMPGQVKQVGAGHIIAFYSPQAGAGVTTLATNVASALMRDNTRVLLVDVNLQFGDVDAFLNLQAPSNIADLSKAVHDLDQELIDNVLVTHGSGLRVLAAPSHPEQAYDIVPEDVRLLIKELARSYDFTVIDMPTLYDDLTLKLLDVAHKIVLVCNPTIPAVRNVRKILDVFDNLQSPAHLVDKVMFVLNRVVNEKDKGRGTVPAASIESHLKLQVTTSIPQDDRSVLMAVNQGVPLVAKLGNRSPGREMVELAEAIRRSVNTQGDQTGLRFQEDSSSRSGLRALFGG